MPYNRYLRESVDQRLKELKAQGLVTREVISARPIAVAYDITQHGRTALDILQRLKDWTEDNNI